MRRLGNRVYVSDKDVKRFRGQWPCCNIPGKGWFEFDKIGDLVDMSYDQDYEGLIGLIEDAQNHGSNQSNHSI